MLTARCPYCDATIHYESDWATVSCTKCGEYIPLTYNRIDNIELENAKSLRSIAMSLQALGTRYVKDYYDQCDSIGPLDG